MDFQLSLNSETVASTNPGQPCAVELGTPVRDVMSLLKAQNAGSALVCRDEILVGFFTERDALKLMASDADLGQPIEAVMTEKPETVHESDTVATAICKMAAGGYRRLPIVDSEGKPTGLVKVSGVVHYLVEHFPETIYNLPPVSGQVSQEREGA